MKARAESASGNRTFLATLCVALMLHIGICATLLTTSQSWFGALAGSQPTLLLVASLMASAQVALLLIIAYSSRRALELRSRSEGRGRALLLSGTAVVYWFVSTLVLMVLAIATYAALPHLLGGTITSLLFALTHFSEFGMDTSWLERVFEIGVPIATGLASLLVALVVGCWFLMPRTRRALLWDGADLLLVAAAVGCSWLFDLQPTPGDPHALLFAALRLTVTSALFIRAGIRFAAPLLRTTEGLGFLPLMASRHLVAKKTPFLAANSLLTIAAIAFSCGMLVTVLSVMGGFRDDLKRKILGNHAHLVVDQERGRFDNWRGVLDATQQTPGVVGASPYVQGEVMMLSVANQSGAILRGIDPERISHVTDLKANIRRGDLRYLSEPKLILQSLAGLDGKQQPPDEKPIDPAPVDSELPGIIVGEELASQLRLVVGDRVRLVAPHGALGPSGPIPKARSFRVAGIFYTGMYEYDIKYAYILLPVAQRFLGMGDAISGVEAKVADVEHASQIAAQVRDRIARPELRVRDWRTLNSQLFGALALEKLAMFITLGIAILVAGFSVFGTLTLLVREKRQEVGVLKAMGASAKRIRRMFMLEGLWVGVGGAVFGLGIGYTTIFAAQHFGIRLKPEVYYIDRLPVHLDPTEFAAVGLSAIAVCLIATLFPAYQAGRFRPVDALRDE